MNKFTIPNLLLFTALTLIVLTACQSAGAEVAGETVTVGSTATNADSTKAEPTFTLTPTGTPEPTATATPAPMDEPAPAPTAEPSPTATAEQPGTPTPSPGIVRTYKIIPDNSEARFYIDEVLFGNPKTVVGRTNQVAGEILLDLQTPQEVEVGTIQVNARGLVTDDSFRNRALRRQILNSAQDEYHFITFTPAETDGLSAAATLIGEAQTFSLTGDLQIRDIVQTVTFEMMVTAVSDTELSGSGEATVLRSDYDLLIPSVPGVADVSDEVKLEIDFMAESAGG